MVEGLEDYIPSASCSFKFGQCSIEVLRLAKKALQDNINNFKIVDGVVYLDRNENAIPHTWIVYKNKVVDPTKSQFGNSEVLYDPVGEYKDEYTPEEFIDSYEEIYGISPEEL